MEVHVPQRKGAVTGMVSGSFRNFVPIVLNAEMVCEKMSIFPYADYILNSVSNCFSYDIVGFKIEVGVKEKFMYKNVTQHTHHGNRYTVQQQATVGRRHCIHRHTERHSL